MRYLIIHNRYSRVGGEEFVVQSQVELLRSIGHQVMLYERSYDEIYSWRWGRVSSFFSALYNRQSVREIKEIIRKFKPECAIIHNLFPVISPAILPILKRGNVRILMTVHNFRLLCPIGVFFTNGKICQKCATSKLRECNCLINKCEKSLLGSLAFAMRGWWSRVRGRGLYTENIDKFLVLSDFQRDILVKYGLPKEKMSVVPNFIDYSMMPKLSLSLTNNSDETNYVGYVGRLSKEKGVELLFEVARLLPNTEFRVAGEFAIDCIDMDAPENVEILGFVNRVELASFYSNATIILCASLWYESFPLVLLEAMYHKKALLVPDVSVLPYVVGDGGVIYPCGDVEQCVSSITELMSNSNLRTELGEKGHKRATTLFTKERYLELIVKNSTATTTLS